MRLSLVDNLLFARRGGETVYDLQPHLGLLSLIAVAQLAGHRCQLIDPKLELHAGRLQLDDTLYRRIAHTILESDPDVVGLTSLGCNFVCTVKVARYLKLEAPSIPIVLGGPHATILDQTILGRFPEFDYIVRHEGEELLLPLLDAIEARALPVNVPGVTYRVDGAVVTNPGATSIDDLDLLPLADYSHYPIRELQLANLRVEAGRGCPYECTFCSTSTFFGRRYRLKSVDRLVSELDNLNRQFGISSFSLTHDLFTVNKAKVREFCNVVRTRNFEWSCSARTDCVDPELLATMRAAGCTAIYYGMETGSARMQHLVRKKLKLAGADPIIDATLQLGIATTVSFITGYPYETEADQNETLDLMGRYYRHDSTALNVQLHLLTPEPGTELMRDGAAELLYDGHISDFNFPTLETDDEDILRTEPGIFVNHHYFPTPIERRRNIFMTDIVPRVQCLGFPILSQIVARFGGRLSAFLENLMRWEPDDASVADYYELLTRFFDAGFGRTDPLSAVVRYATSGARLLEKTCHSVGPGALQSVGRFRLSPTAALLRDMPDVPAMIDGINTARSSGRTELLPPTTGERGDWLICVDQRGKRSLRNFRLTPVAAELVAFLSMPRTAAECRDRLSVKQPADDVDDFLAQLSREGLLEFVPAFLPGARSVARPFEVSVMTGDD
jgi:radical SAM superfamily enzyme YgiQ (UPF0313 family)